MRKSTGFLLAGIATGVAAGCVYYVYKNKEKFFKEEMEADSEGNTKRVYTKIDVDGAKETINNTINKTRNLGIQTVKKAAAKFDEFADGLTESPVTEPATGYSYEEIVYEDFSDKAQKEEVAKEATPAEFVTFDIKNESEEKENSKAEPKNDEKVKEEKADAKPAADKPAKPTAKKSNKKK